MKLALQVLFWIGRIQYTLFSTTNKYSYLAFRRLHGITNGSINEFFSRKISKQRGKYDFPTLTNGLTGDLDKQRLDHIIDEIQKNGFYIFNETLDPAICDEIKQFSLGLEANTVGGDTSIKKAKYNKDNSLASLYKYDSQDIVENKHVQDIFFDLNFMRIAQSYLGCKPLNNSILMWWSALYSKSANSKAAQLYHFDMDRPKFIKFFIYLTDVDTDSGPHCFIRATHNHKPLNLREDRRFSENEIKSAFDESDIIEITGKKGTIVAVDTSGIHKGKIPISNDRLIIQLEYSNSFFGQQKQTLQKPKIYSESHKNIMREYQDVFERLTP